MKSIHIYGPLSRRILLKSSLMKMSLLREMMKRIIIIYYWLDVEHVFLV